MARRLVGTNHVNLTVRDLDRSTEWYCRVFGLTVVSTDESIEPPYFTDVTYNGLFDLSSLSYVVGLIDTVTRSPAYSMHVESGWITSAPKYPRRKAFRSGQTTWANWASATRE